MVAEAGGDLAERVQAAGHPGQVAAFGAGVEVGQRVLLRGRPVPAGGGQPGQREARAGGQQPVAELARATSWARVAVASAASSPSRRCVSASRLSAHAMQ